MIHAQAQQLVAIYGIYILQNTSILETDIRETGDTNGT